MRALQLILGSLLSIFAIGPYLSSANADELTPRQTLQAWSKAWSTGKTEAMMEFYADSPRLVAIASSGHAYAGRAEVEKMYRSAFREATWEAVRLQQLELDATEDVAWGSCRFVADMIDRASGEKLLFTSQGTIVMRRQDGEWKIVLEHFSPIQGRPRVELQTE